MNFCSTMSSMPPTATSWPKDIMQRYDICIRKYLSHSSTQIVHCTKNSRHGDTSNASMHPCLVAVTNTFTTWNSDVLARPYHVHRLQPTNDEHRRCTYIPTSVWIPYTPPWPIWHHHGTEVSKVVPTDACVVPFDPFVALRHGRYPVVTKVIVGPLVRMPMTFAIADPPLATLSA